MLMPETAEERAQRRADNIRLWRDLLIGIGVLIAILLLAPTSDAAAPRVDLVASHYSDIGGPVACGPGRKPATGHGVASKVYPCGTRLGICRFGACIEARVVDHGPNVKGRDLDLFEPTFAAVAPLSIGVVVVSVRVHNVARCVPRWVVPKGTRPYRGARYAPVCGATR